MKNNQLIAIMVALLFVCTMGTIWYTYRGTKLSNRLNSLGNQLGVANNMRSLMGMVYGQATEYSKNHPDIIPILQGVTNNAAAPTAPAGKPAGK